MFLLIKKSPRATFGLVTCGSFCPDPRQAEQREDENASVHQAQENRRTQVHSVTSGRMDSQDRLPGRTDHSRQACGRHARARARASGQSLLEVSGIQSHADRCGGGVCVCVLCPGSLSRAPRLPLVLLRASWHTHRCGCRRLAGHTGPAQPSLQSLEQGKDLSFLPSQVVAVLPRLGVGWEGARWGLGFLRVPPGKTWGRLLGDGRHPAWTLSSALEGCGRWGPGAV